MLEQKGTRLLNLSTTLIARMDAMTSGAYDPEQSGPGQSPLQDAQQALQVLQEVQQIHGMVCGSGAPKSHSNKALTCSSQIGGVTRDVRVQTQLDIAKCAMTLSDFTYAGIAIEIATQLIQEPEATSAYACR